MLRKPFVSFLGHQVDSEGIRPLPEKVSAIKQFPLPTSKLDVQRLLGCVNFYRRFLPCLAQIVRPLTDSLSKAKKDFTVTPAMITAVNQVKNAISSATMLVHPCRDVVLSITTDASDTAIGGVLHQHHRGRLEPLSFFSRRLSDPETRYSTFDRELLAVAATVRKFRRMIEGRRLVIYTDHKSLTSSISKANSTSAWSLRAERNLLYISQFSCDIRHVSGESNQVADALSRPPDAPAPPPDEDWSNEIEVNEPKFILSPTPSPTPPPTTPSSTSPSTSSTPSAPSSRGRTGEPSGITGVGDVRQVYDLSTNLPAEAGVDLTALQQQQMTDEDAARLAKLKGFSFSFVMFNDVKLVCDVSTGVPRPVVPKEFCRRIFDAIHSLSHAGTRAMRRLITRRWLWSRMQADISAWCKQCLQCQTSKVTRHTVPELQEIPIPTRRFTEVNVDIVGPLPPSQGYRYLLTMIDRNTRWVEVLELQDISSSTVVSGFLQAWISRFGVPVTVVTDRGCQFTGESSSTMCSQLHISHRTTTSYHPQNNGMIERIHRNLKSSLRAKCVSANWVSELPFILLGLRVAPCESDSISSFKRVYGVPPILPGEFWSGPETPNPEFLTKFQQALSFYSPPTSSPNRSVQPFLPADLVSCKFVFVRVDGSGRPPLAPLYSGPFLVIQRYRSTFKLQVGTREEVVNISRLKPAFTPEDASPAQPPK